ncbi:MAG: acyltransferase family protein, partial [Peptostreptococcales bacterium]
MKSRLVELDYMRGLACIAVVLTHITALGVVEYLPGSPHKILSTYMNRSFNFTVPVFIFLSGLTGFLGYTKKPFHYGVFLKKRLGKIV